MRARIEANIPGVTERDFMYPHISAHDALRMRIDILVRKRSPKRSGDVEILSLNAPRGNSRLLGFPSEYIDVTLNE